MIFAIEDHYRNHPGNWRVLKIKDGLWGMFPPNSDLTLETFPTKKRAMEERATGHLCRLYHKEAAWLRGKQIDNWRPASQEEMEAYEKGKSKFLLEFYSTN